MKSKFSVFLTWMFVSAFLVGSASAADNAFGSLISDNVDNSSVSMPFEQGQVIDMTLHPLIRNATATIASTHILHLTSHHRIHIL